MLLRYHKNHLGALQHSYQSKAWPNNI
jgi:hypothetical protein